MRTMRNVIVMTVLMAVAGAGVAYGGTISLPLGETTIAHDSAFPALTDALYYYHDTSAPAIYVSSGTLRIPEGTGSADDGWVVFAYDAGTDNTISSVTSRIKTYVSAAVDNWEIKCYWTTDSYAGTSDPVPGDWTEYMNIITTGDLWSSEVTFTPNSQTLFIAYRIWADDLPHSYDCIIKGDDNDFTVVPEPATMALLGLGSVGLLIRRKRRA